MEGLVNTKYNARTNRSGWRRDLDWSERDVLNGQTFCGGDVNRGEAASLAKFG